MLNRQQSKSEWVSSCLELFSFAALFFRFESSTNKIGLLFYINQAAWILHLKRVPFRRVLRQNHVRRT